MKYEARTLRTIRGMESRTISKWEKEGWEVISQSQGMLQTEISIRRPKPKMPRQQLIALVAGGVAVAILMIVLAVTGTIGDSDRVEQAATAPPTVEASPTPSETAMDNQAPTESVKSETAVLTPSNNPELAALLALADYCDGSIAEFANKFGGQTIDFSGHISAMNSHNGASTRFDILIGAGDFSETSSSGPAFQFRDVNATNDLRYTGDVPDTIGVGTNLQVAARVGAYETNSCLFLLQPVETAVR